MPNQDTGVKFEMPNQDTSIKPEIKTGPFGPSATDKSPPGPGMHGQVKLDPVSLSGSASEAPSPSRSTMNQGTNGTTPNQPVQTPFRITRSMTRAKLLAQTQRAVKQEYSVFGTGQSHSPFIILEP
jgi:hypothetical protein